MNKKKKKYSPRFNPSPAPAGRRDADDPPAALLKAPDAARGSQPVEVGQPKKTKAMTVLEVRFRAKWEQLEN